MRQRYAWLAIILVAAMAMAVASTTTRGTPDHVLAQVPTATPQCVNCSTSSRDCPETAQYCLFGNCYHVFTLSCPDLMCSGEAADFYVHLSGIQYCDECVDVWSMTARLYGDSGYLGGGTLSPSVGGSYYCVSEMPTSVVVVWDGDYDCNYYTKGVKNLAVDICCADCDDWYSTTEHLVGRSPTTADHLAPTGFNVAEH